MNANVVGLFSGITGVIHFDPPDISHLSLEAEIDVASLTTGHPMTHPVTLEAEYFGPVKSPFSGKICIDFTATGQINREEYGMTWNEGMEGGVVIGKEVQITIE